MSKDCNSCDYCEGWCWDDGMPQCTYQDEASGEKGYEYCPYNDQSTIKNNGMKIEIDSGFMSEYIRHTIQNTVDEKAINIAELEVQRIIDDQTKESIRQKVKSKIDEKINSIVDRAFDEFLDHTISVGGGFLSEAKTMTRREYIAKEIEKKLSDINVNKIKSIVDSETKYQIDGYTQKLR